MNTLLTKIRSTVNRLGISSGKKEIELVDKLIEQLSLYKHELNKKNHKQIEKSQSKLDHPKFQLEKVSDEMFLYKPVTVKNYYDGDYLERFSDIRTSDLSYSGVLEIHNKFWNAHEIISGNIFATLPLELISNAQSKQLEKLSWNPIKADIFEVKGESNLSKLALINSIEEMFSNYLLIREVSGNILMVLDFKNS